WMTRPVPGYALGPNEMWRHAFATAVGAQHIAGLSRRVKEDVAFTAGLLHDIGKVALSVWIENKIQAIAFYAQREKISFDEAERKVLGYDHTQVGEHLAKAWNLPDEICEVVRFHHHPEYAPASSDLVDCVHVGDFLAMSMGFGLGGDGMQYQLDEGAMDRLGIEFDDIDGITDSFVESFEKYETMFAEIAA
ncbi:MAG: HDOD domain-containing protein, partial [Armatimonadota bacterium]